MRFLIIFLSISISLFAQLLHRPNYSDENSKRLVIPYGSVINYFPVTQIYDISEDQSYYYLATNGGIWRYHKYEEEWDYPLTKGQGLPQNTILHVYYWENRDVLYAETPGYHCVYNPTWEIWENHRKRSGNDSWPGGVTLSELRKEMAQNKAKKMHAVNSMPMHAALTDDRNYTMRGDAVLISPNGEEFPLTTKYTTFRQDIIYIIKGFGIGLSNEYDVSIRLFRLSVPNVSLSDLYIDGELYWIGGQAGKGYNSFGAIALWPDLKSSWIHYYKKNSSAFAHSFSVSRFAANRSHLYAATDNGILEYDNNSDEWQTLAGTMNKAYSNIVDMALFDSLIFLGTGDGLVAWDPQIKQFTFQQNPLSNTRIYDLFADKKNLFIASNQGVYRLSPENLYPLQVNYLSTTVGGIPRAIRTVKNELWVGTDMGWVWFNQKTANWQGQLLSDFRLKGPVTDMAIDDKDAFFLVPAGIIHWNRKKDFYRFYNKRVGLPTGGYRRIILDGDALWVISTRAATQIFFEEMKF